MQPGVLGTDSGRPLLQITSRCMHWLRMATLLASSWKIYGLNHVGAPPRIIYFPRSQETSAGK